MTGGMLDRLGTGGRTATELRAGMTGGPDVEAIVTGCADGAAFGLGGMYGVSFSFSPLEAIFAVAAAALLELAMLSRRGTGTAPAASGRGVGTGAG